MEPLRAEVRRLKHEMAGAKGGYKKEIEGLREQVASLKREVLQLKAAPKKM